MVALKKPIQSSPKGPDMLGWAGHHVEAIYQCLIRKYWISFKYLLTLYNELIKFT